MTPNCWCSSPFFIATPSAVHNFWTESIHNILDKTYFANKMLIQYFNVWLVHNFSLSSKKLAPLKLMGLSRSDQRAVRKGPLCHNFSLVATSSCCTFYFESITARLIWSKPSQMILMQPGKDKRSRFQFSKYPLQFLGKPEHGLPNKRELSWKRGGWTSVKSQVVD